MRVNPFLRAVAINSMDAQELADGSWENAKKYLEQAVSEQPNRAIHHLDLARVYADMGDKAKAKTEYEAVLKAPIFDYNDHRYKEAAQQGLK
jgi:Tfp pilus assembly protein PilF